MSKDGSNRLSARHRARRLVLQALYQWIMSDNDPREIANQMREDADGRIDWNFFDQLFPAIPDGKSKLELQLQPVMDDRSLDPVEQAVIWLGAFELANQPDTPYRVVINEAVKLARDFGATDGYKYVNAVLDKLAARLRGSEVAAR